MKAGLRLAARWAGIGLLVGAAALFLSTSGPPPTQPVLTGYGTSLQSSSPSPRLARPGSVFQITGRVAGLYPGQSGPLQLTVTNPQRYSITVTSIATTVGSASSSCPGTYLQVTAFSGSVVVAAQHQVAVTVTATMLSTAPDGCQGTTFPLVYAGTGQVP